MTGPLDLGAVEDELAGAGCLRPRTAVALMAAVGTSMAEVERLRAENEMLGRTIERTVDVLEELRADSVPRSSLERLKDWRWCEAKNAPEVWEDGNGCLWCTKDTHHPRLYVIREDTDA